MSYRTYASDRITNGTVSLDVLGRIWIRIRIHDSNPDPKPFRTRNTGAEYSDTPTRPDSMNLDPNPVQK